MAFTAQVLTVLIASPQDVAQDRDVVEAVVRSWNADRARNMRLVLLPVRWEENAVSIMGDGGPQDQINHQFGDSADIVVGLFHGRLGTPTRTAPSGTVEELDRAIRRQSRVHIFFSEMAHPHSVDPDQLKAVRSYRRECAQKGLVGTYDSFDHLRRITRRALEKDASDYSDTAPAGREGHRVNRGLVQVHLEREVDSWSRSVVRSAEAPAYRLIVRNVGTVPLGDVQVRLAAHSAGGTPIHRFGEYEPASLAPGQDMGRPVYVTAGTAEELEVVLEWCAEGRSETCSLVVQVER